VGWLASWYRQRARAKCARLTIRFGVGEERWAPVKFETQVAREDGLVTSVLT